MIAVEMMKEILEKYDKKYGKQAIEKGLFEPMILVSDEFYDMLMRDIDPRTMEEILSGKVKHDDSLYPESKTIRFRGILIDVSQRMTGKQTEFCLRGLK
jgi:hypothetical protein